MPARTLNLLKQLLLFAVLAASSPTAIAQSTPASDLANPPTFEVATIKPTDERPSVMHRAGVQLFPGGRLVINATSLKGLMSVAYHIGYWQMSGGEDWMDKARFDIEAKPSDEWQAKITNLRHSNFTIEDETQRSMLQALLADRFQLKVHRETKTGKVFLLEQNGKGIKLQPTKVTATDHPYGEGYSGDISRAGNRWGLYNTSMPQLAKFAGDYILHAPVIDRTGLTGSFDHRWTMDIPDDPEGRNFDFQGNFPLFVEEMGLKFTRSTGPVETLVIDHAEKPSEN